jgi:GNAT superfamily N-acetyltransferase
MLEVTKLTPADHALWKRLFSYAVGPAREAPDLYERVWAAFMADQRLHALGARLDGKLVGVAQFFVHPSTTGPDACYLEHLFTRPAWRRKGVGRALVVAVTAWARSRGCGRLYWLTHETNTEARALYDQVAERSGFIEYEILLK